MYQKFIVEVWFSSDYHIDRAEVEASVERGIEKTGYCVNASRWETGKEVSPGELHGIGEPEVVENVDFVGVTKVREIIDEIFAEDEERYTAERTCSGHLWRELKTTQDVERCVANYLKVFCGDHAHCTDCDFYDRLNDEFRGGIE